MSDDPEEPIAENPTSSPRDGEPTEPGEADATAQSATASSEAAPSSPRPADEENPSFESRGSGMRGRDVEVPMRVYKTVTVFSTLIAVVCVVGGFIILDRATGRAQLPLSEVDPVLAILGIGTILFGAAIYAYGTRFRAAGMGSSKNDDDEAADNG